MTRIRVTTLKDLQEELDKRKGEIKAWWEDKEMDDIQFQTHHETIVFGKELYGKENKDPHPLKKIIRSKKGRNQIVKDYGCSTKNPPRKK